MTFQSIPIRSLRTNSLATDLFHTCQETTALNQFHHGFNGLRTQHSFLGVTPQYNFISNGQKTQYPFIGPTTQYSFIGPTTPYHIICATTLSFVYGPVTLKQGNIETSVYCDLSEFKLVTPPITLLSSLFNCKNQCTGKTQQSILNLNKVNFFFCSITTTYTSQFLLCIKAQFWQKFKKRLTFWYDWNINCKSYIFVVSLHDVYILIARILMKFQRYIIRRHDFACYWRSLPFPQLLKLQYFSFWVLIVLFRPMSIFFLNVYFFWVNHTICFINDIIFPCTYLYFIRLFMYLYVIIQNCFTKFWKLTIAISSNKIKKIILCTTFLLAHFYKWTSFIFYMPKSPNFNTSDKEIMHNFVGGGPSARFDFKMLKPYIISTNFQVQNPENFYYLYDGHGSSNKVSQKIQEYTENHIICNIPLSFIATILTTTQTNEIAKEHNLHFLARKPLAEKQTVIKSHICSKICKEKLTLFKAVQINQKKKVISQSKLGRKYWTKSKQTVVNHRYYIKNNVQFPPSPPSNRLMQKIITGFCNDTHPVKLEEAGCAVCGQLVNISNLKN